MSLTPIKIHSNAVYKIGILKRENRRNNYMGDSSPTVSWKEAPISIRGSQLIEYQCKNFDDFFKLNPLQRKTGVTHSVYLIKPAAEGTRSEEYLTEGTFFSFPDSRYTVPPADAAPTAEGPYIPPVPSIVYTDASAGGGSASLRGAREQIELLKEQLNFEREKNQIDHERHEAELSRIREFYSEQSTLSIASLRQEKDAIIGRLQSELDTLRATSAEQIATLNSRIHQLELENNKHLVTNEIDEKYQKELDDFKNKSGGLADSSTITALIQALPVIAPMLQSLFSSSPAPSPAPQMGAMAAPGFQQGAIQGAPGYPPQGVPTPPPPTPPVRPHQYAPSNHTVILDE